MYSDLPTENGNEPRTPMVGEGPDEPDEHTPMLGTDPEQVVPDNVETPMVGGEIDPGKVTREATTAGTPEPD